MHQLSCRVYKCLTKCGYFSQEIAERSLTVNYRLNKSDVHVAVHLDTFLIIEPTRFTNFSNLFLE